MVSGMVTLARVAATAASDSSKIPPNKALFRIMYPPCLCGYYMKSGKNRQPSAKSSKLGHVVKKFFFRYNRDDEPAGCGRGNSAGPKKAGKERR